MVKFYRTCFFILLNLYCHYTHCRSWVIFYADNTTLTGHSFVSFVKEDPALQQTIIVGCWGFYPKKGLGVWGDVEGQIRNDILRQKDVGFMVEVCESEFNRCLAKKNEWEAKQYSLTSNNCVNFIEDVARQIFWLVLPKSGTWLPINYVNTLKSLNNKVAPPNTCAINTSLFLIDVSGSMNENNKIGQAKQAASSTINTIKQESQQSNKTPEIGIMVFSGGCSPNPTTIVQPFTSNLDEAFNSIQKIPSPNGGTPLPEAVERAKETLQKRLNETGQSCGSLIVLGDGQSSCGAIIPPDAFAGVKDRLKVCGQQSSPGAFNINLFTVGFGVPPGSVSERELQYLSNSTGGKYFNAQDQYQLTRSFQKINRIYTPISNTQTKNVDAVSSTFFNTAFAFVTATQQYDTAVVLYKKFVSSYPTDSSGLYNYALMCEANERYKTAVKYYELYLQSAPNDPSRPFLLERIETLKKDYEIYVAYSKQLIISDLAYLEQHFKQLQTTPNAVPLAGEFIGFIKEKQTFYKFLPETLEMEEPWLKQYSKEIAQAFKQASYFLSKSPKKWDLDGISMIGGIYEPLSRLSKKF